jgi:hypothetical protein
VRRDLCCVPRAPPGLPPPDTAPLHAPLPARTQGL